MADYILQKEYERVVKKHGTAMSNVNKAIDTALGDLEKIYAKLDGDSEKPAEAMDVDGGASDSKA